MNKKGYFYSHENIISYGIPLLARFFIPHYQALCKDPYFSRPGISWRAQKNQVNIISHHRKVQNKNFSVTSKYHLSINFLTQKRPYFPSSKSSKQGLFSNQLIPSFHQLFATKKDCISHSRILKIRAFQ